jgi:ribose-phosphate pyrophosphokinase
MTEALLAFDDERHLAGPLAASLAVPLHCIERHGFPDGESRLRLPARLPPRTALLRGLHQPNAKLAELLIAAPAARALGAAHLTLCLLYTSDAADDM